MKSWFSLILVYIGLIWSLEPAWGSQEYITNEIYIPRIERRIENLNSLYDQLQASEKEKAKQREKSVQVLWRQQKTIKARVFGYTSLVELTDSTPFITASGERVYVGGIANNCQKFGTKVQIGGKVFTVNDRMASRYGCSDWDIWFETYQEAKEWGVKEVEVTIL